MQYAYKIISSSVDDQVLNMHLNLVRKHKYVSIVCECVNEHGYAYAFVICNIGGFFFLHICIFSTFLIMRKC